MIESNQLCKSTGRFKFAVGMRSPYMQVRNSLAIMKVDNQFNSHPNFLATVINRIKRMIQFNV
jgi:hypothetical protein